MGVSFRLCSGRHLDAGRNFQRFGLIGPVGRDRALDWLASLGQGVRANPRSGGFVAFSYFFGMNSVASHKFSARTQLSVLLLAGTMLATPVAAQQVAPPTVPAPAPEAAPTATTVQSITVVGN